MATPKTNMKRTMALCLGLFFISLNTLILELLLIRVFDTILLPNLGYAVITCAMFAFALAGVYATIFPPPEQHHMRRRLCLLSTLFGASVLLLRPALNATPLIYEHIPNGALKHLTAGSAIYLLLLTPFFLSGLMFAYLFSAYPSRIRSLYFWDLGGAALGCVAFLPFFPMIGPGGLMFWSAAMLLLAGALFAGRKSLFLFFTLLALLLVAVLFVKTDRYFDFVELMDKRGVREAREAGRIEATLWDPVSKIDVVNSSIVDKASKHIIPRPKHVAYDGGSQSSHFFPFDGNYKELRRIVSEGGQRLTDHFWQRGVLVSHYLKRDSAANVLIIGSAAGQEIKAALLFNAGRVDGIELVNAVVSLGKNRYAPYTGNIFNDPRVNNQVGEGRSYLRGTTQRYDIIQIFSNHTSSYIATGMGAVTPTYLQTVEAYSEYFSHLNSDGILHINHHFYPRMVTTAAHAWTRVHRNDFQRHVVIFERQGINDTLPTMLIKMSPWTGQELAQLRTFWAQGGDAEGTTQLVVNPLDPANSFLSEAFFRNPLPAEVKGKINYRVSPSTDDWPYFSNIQKAVLQANSRPGDFLNQSMASALTGRRSQWPAGEYSMFVVIAGVGSLFSIILILLPLRLSEAGRIQWPCRYASIGYFSCLGAAFIVVELMLIQVFMKLVGHPLYTYSVVIFTILFSAALGSGAAKYLDVNPARRWAIPFLGLLGVGTTLWIVYPHLIDLSLAASQTGRIAAAAAMITPLGFFMGMPLPLGILSLEKQPKGAIAWAWGMNGFFTVIGGAGAAFISLFVGFRLTLLLALGIYGLASLLFMRMRTAASIVDESVIRISVPTQSAAPLEQAYPQSPSGGSWSPR